MDAVVDYFIQCLYYERRNSVVFLENKRFHFQEKRPSNRLFGFVCFVAGFLPLFGHSIGYRYLCFVVGCQQQVPEKVIFQ